MSTIPVEIVRHFEAAPERVFDAWIDPKTAGNWLFATPTGEMQRVELDPRVGGRWTIVERRDGEDVLHTGEYLEVDRPRRLVFTLAVEKYAADPTVVRVEFAPSSTGSDVKVAHEIDAKMAEFAERTKQGWTMILESLARELGEAEA